MFTHASPRYSKIQGYSHTMIQCNLAVTKFRIQTPDCGQYQHRTARLHLSSFLQRHTYDILIHSCIVIRTIQNVLVDEDLSLQDNLRPVHFGKKFTTWNLVISLTKPVNCIDGYLPPEETGHYLRCSNFNYYDTNVTSRNRLRLLSCIEHDILCVHSLDYCDSIISVQ